MKTLEMAELTCLALYAGWQPHTALIPKLPLGETWHKALSVYRTSATKDSETEFLFSHY